MASLRPPIASRGAPAALPGGRARHLLTIAVVCLNAWLLVQFHDQFWWAPDEGNYAHVAERLLDGQVLHADVQDIHPGYVNFANAGALALFGRELTSLRYPLVLLGIAQSLILLLLLRPVGGAPAAVGATAITALGFLQFLNPSAHWYCLFLVILLAGVLHSVPRESRWRLEAIGVLVMTIVLFRQLTGVLVAMGALTWLLLEPDISSAGAHERNGDAGAPAARRPWLARGVLVVMLVGLVGYLARATDSIGWLLFGIWPVLLLLVALRWAHPANGRVIGMLARLARGALVAMLPLIGYHIVNGSLGAWFGDAVLAAMRLPRMPFFDRASYATNFAEALQAVASGEPRALLNGGFWLVVPLIAAAVGAVLLARLARSDGRVPEGAAPARPAVPALPVLAVFYAVVSVHYQIPIYLSYSAGLSLAALLMLTRGARVLTIAGAAVVAIATVYHAGQPLSRGYQGAATGRRVPLVASDSLPRLGLRIEPSDVALYGALLELIEREVPPDAPIFAVPSHAELYFLSGRRNPTRFYNSALGVTTPRELARVLETLERDPPLLVFYDRADKYNTPASRAIVARVARAYEPLAPIGRFEVFRLRHARGRVATPVPAPSSLE